MKNLKGLLGNKRNLPLVLSIVVVAAAVVIIGWVIYKDHHKKTQQQAVSPQSFNIAYKDAAAQANLRKFATAISELNNASPANQFQARERYYEIGLLYYDQSNYQLALNYILKSYNINPSSTDSGTLEFISQIYSKVGNQALSKEFYEKAAQKAKTGSGPIYGFGTRNTDYKSTYLVEVVA